MNKNRISVSIRGKKPTPWGSNEWEWRKAIAIEANKQKQIRGHAGVLLKFEVEIIFHMRTTTFKKSDLDNLAKPVLDTLFQPYDVQVKDKSLSGALFELDDNQVHKLLLEKRLVNTYQEEGADINVSWEE